MTPFDPQALLVMLLTFYPIVSPENLVRAWRERPQYFAGGVLIGKWPEVLRLPDAREWDLIFSVSEPHLRRWQVIPAGGGGGDDEFELEEGPLTPIVLPPEVDPEDRRDFEVLVAGAALQLGAVDDVLADGEGALTEASSSAALEDSYGETVERAMHDTGDEESFWESEDIAALSIASDALLKTAEHEEGELPTFVAPPGLPEQPRRAEPDPPPDLPNPIPEMPGPIGGGD